MNKEEQLRSQGQAFTRLQGLTEQPGWQDFIDLAGAEYSAALEQLKSPKSVKAEVEARGAIKCLDRLFEAFSTDWQLAKIAQEKYVQKFLKPASVG